MKLRNKKTGEVKECVVIPIDDNGYPNEYQVFEKGDSLAELNEEWEDYEEPKRTWFIDTWGSIREREAMEIPIGWKEKPILEFETEEEAEKAVEKLKAWKRLKDKGFRFEGWNCALRELYFDVPDTFYDRPDMVGEAISEETTKDLDLIFGGEE